MPFKSLVSKLILFFTYWTKDGPARLEEMRKTMGKIHGCSKEGHIEDWRDRGGFNG